jgi:hypothetical protein
MITSCSAMPLATPRSSHGFEKIPRVGRRATKAYTRWAVIRTENMIARAWLHGSSHA